MSTDCLLTTHHSVEFIRKGRRLVEREPFRLDVQCKLETLSAADLPEVFVREFNGRPRVALHGYNGRFWRPACVRDRAAWNFEASLQNGILELASAIDPAMALPVRKEGAPPLEPFDDVDKRIISDDREERLTAAREACRKAIIVDGQLWIQVRSPEWLVRKAADPRQSDIRLLDDIHEDWRAHVVRDYMRFRLDRLPQALAWPKAVRGRMPGDVARRSRTEIEADILGGPWNVTRIDLAYADREDDLVTFARDHLRRTIEACADVIELAPERLRRRWEELRILHESIRGPAARRAAEAGLVLVADTLAMLTEVRDLPSERRSVLLREITRLRQNDRRTYMIEGLFAPAQEAEIDEAHLSDLVP